jgi:hypothetical protein
MAKGVLLLLLASAGLALLVRVWSAVRAACRKLGMGTRLQVLIAGAVCSVCLMPFLVWLYEQEYGAVDKVVAVLVIACLGGALFVGVWSALRAIGRKLGIGDTYQIFIAGGACATPFLVWMLVNFDRLDSLERTCKSELLKTRRMAGATEVSVEEHYDFWTKTISGGGMAAPWISRPYETPKVWLTVEFTREGEGHRAFIECVFSKIPNTGDPPEVTFQGVQIGSEDVRRNLSDGGYTWDLWLGKPADADKAHDAADR